jgi:HAMP domain-containing protein
LRLFEKDLRVKITAILLVFILLAVGASLIVSYTIVTGIIRKNIVQSNGDAARLSAEIINVALDRRASRLDLLTNLPAIKDPAVGASVKSDTLGLFMETWPLGQEALMVDTNGKIICGTGKIGNLPNASGTSWYENAQSGRTAFTYIYNTSELTGAFFSAPVLAVSAPVRDSLNQIYAYVVTFTNVEDIAKGVNAVMLEKTGHGFLVNDRGVLIAGKVFPPEGKPSASDKKAMEELVGQMSKGGTGDASVRYGGRSYLVSWVPVSSSETAGLGWTVGVAVPTAEALAPANRVTLALSLLAIVILLGGAIVAVLLGRSIIRPIDELVSNAEKIGSGDLTGDVAIRSRDQIGALAAAFLRMRDYLRSALAEAGYVADKMSVLADEQSAGTRDFLDNTEEIVESVIVLSKNLESQTQKIRKVLDTMEKMPESARAQPVVAEAAQLLRESDILAEVGASKAVEIASATQDQRGAARDVAAAARRLSDMARELKEMVKKFTV